MELNYETALVVGLDSSYIIQDKITGKPSKLSLKCSKGKKYVTYQLIAETTHGNMQLTEPFAIIDQPSSFHGCSNVRDKKEAYVILDMENDNKLDILFFPNGRVGLRSFLFIPDIYDAN